ncbi:MAG: DUF6531 domain-containing protein, partial [Phycisphaerae bacterium]
MMTPTHRACLLLGSLLASTASMQADDGARTPAVSAARAPGRRVAANHSSRVMVPMKRASVRPAKGSSLRSGTVPYDPTSVYDQRGFRTPRGFSVEALHEAVDPFSGNLLLTHTDLDLPGVGGLDLNIQRVYNSKIHRNYAVRATGDPDRIALGMLFVPPSPVGLGWNLHMGRLVGAVSGARNDLLPGPRYFERPDGSQQTFFQYTGPGCGNEVDDICLVSKDRDNLYQTGPDDTWVVSTPDGLNTVLGHAAFDGSTLVHYATEIRDVHGNNIEISYLDNTIDIGGQMYERDYLRHFIDTIIDSAGRVISFNYDLVAGDQIRLASIEVNNVTHQYFYAPETPLLQTFLTEVRPPAGASWRYAYDGLTTGDCEANDMRWCELTQITYPQGGTITYAFEDLTFWAQTNPMSVRAVTQRDVAGREVTPGTWTYAYNRASDYAGDDHTIITRPDDSQEIYTYFGVGAGPYNPVGLAWKAGALLQKRILATDATLMETETYDWQPSPPLSDEIWGDPFIGFDVGILIPRMVTKTVQRGSLSWTVEHTTFHDSNDRPRCTTESGDGDERYRIQVYQEQVQWQGDLLYRHPNLIVLEVLSYDAFPADACDPDQSSGFAAQPPDEVLQRAHNDLGKTVTRIHNGRQTDFTYHGTGDLATETVYRANDRGNPSDGVCSSYDNYQSGVPRQIEHGAGSDCATGLTSEIRSVDSFGRVDGVTDGRGNTTTLSYDAIGRLDGIVPPPASGESAVVITRDGSSGSPETYQRITQGPYWIEKRVDGFGRETEREIVSGVVFHRDYDALGQTTFESQPGFGGGAPGDTFAYDALGRLTGVTHADATVRSLTYGVGQHTVTVTDEKQRQAVVTRRAYGHPDDFRIIRVQLPGETAPASDTYEYLVGGHLTRVNYAGRQRVINYDFLKNVVHEFSVETNNLFWGFDGAGNLRCRDRGDAPDRCSNGNLNDPDALVRYEVDNLGRATHVHYADPATPDLTFGYDEVGNLITMTDGVGSHTFTYTGTNRPETRTSIINAVTYETGYDYDDRGNLTEITYPSGRVVTYDYDAANRVTTVHDDSTPYVQNVSYLPTGSPESWTYGNGITTTVTLEARQRTDTMSAPVVYDLDYDYDGVGNVESLTDPITAYAGSFIYDDLDRLDTANGPWGSLEYLYTNAGDRFRQTLNGTFRFFNFDNFGQLTSTSGTPALRFTYDDFGNTTSRGFFSNERYAYTYDAENRIVDVTYHDGSGGVDTVVAYGYDGQDRRMVEDRFDPTSSRVLHYDSNGHRLAESTPLGDMATEYILFDNKTVAALDVRQLPGDADCDRILDEDDVGIFRDCFGELGSPVVRGGEPVCDAADIDGDMDVDCNDAQPALAVLNDSTCATGDFDCNGTVDESDYVIMTAAMLGPDADSPCDTLDGDGDGNLDLGDFADMQRAFVRFTKFWVSDADGFWDEPANWSDGTLPGPNDVVLIDRAGVDLTVTVRQGEQSCNRLVSTERLVVDGGRLSVAGRLRVDNELKLGNGIIADATLVAGLQGQTLTPSTNAESDGRLEDVIIASEVNVPDQHTLVLGGVVAIDETITIEPGGKLAMASGGTITGEGSVLFAQTCGDCRVECDDCTIDSGILIRGRSGSVRADFDSTQCNMRGTIVADGPGGIVVEGHAWINEGTMEATDGAFVQFRSPGGGKITNAGLLLASPGGRVMVETFDNDGVIRADGGRIILRGSFVLDDVGTIDGTLGSVEVEGFMDLEGGTLAIDDQSGSWLMSGSTARIENGTITTEGGAVLAAQGTGTLWRVRVDGDLETRNSRFNIWDRVELNGVVRLNPGDNPTGNLNRLIADKLLLPNDGITRLGGTGEIVLDDATVPGQNRITFDTNSHDTLLIEPELTLRT